MKREIINWNLTKTKYVQIFRMLIVSSMYNVHGWSFPLAELKGLRYKTYWVQEPNKYAYHSFLAGEQYNSTVRTSEESYYYFITVYLKTFAFLTLHHNDSEVLSGHRYAPNKKTTRKNSYVHVIQYFSVFSLIYVYILFSFSMLSFKRLSLLIKSGQESKKVCWLVLEI